MGVTIYLLTGMILQVPPPSKMKEYPLKRDHFNRRLVFQTSFFFEAMLVFGGVPHGRYLMKVGAFFSDVAGARLFYLWLEITTQPNTNFPWEI